MLIKSRRLQVTRRLLHFLLLLMSLPQPSRARIIHKCELTQLLRRHGIIEKDIPDWLCLAHRESRYDTSAMGRLNADGSRDHGLFQISDKYWCDYSQWDPRRHYKNVCQTSCDAFRDEDLDDDMSCAMQIHQEHHRLQGNGLMAWSAWRNFCTGTSMEAYNPADCDSVSTRWDPSTERIDTFIQDKPEVFAPSPQLSEFFTNGQVIHPHDKALSKSTLRVKPNKDRLEPYTRIRGGWKPPKSKTVRPAVTWGPELSTTPALPQRWTSNSQWQSRTTKAPRRGWTTNAPWRSWTTKSPWRRTNIRKPTTPRPWQHTNTLTPRPQGGQTGQHPYNSNIFLSNTGSDVPKTNPYGHNIFLSGFSADTTFSPDPFAHNVFLSQSSSASLSNLNDGSSSVSQTGGYQNRYPAIDRNFENNVFLNAVANKQTQDWVDPIEELQKRLPPVTADFGHNIFLANKQTAQQGNNKQIEQLLTTKRPWTFTGNSKVQKSQTQFTSPNQPTAGDLSQNPFISGAVQRQRMHQSPGTGNRASVQRPTTRRPYVDSGWDTTRPTFTQSKPTRRPRPQSRRRYQTINRNRGNRPLTSSSRASVTETNAASILTEKSDDESMRDDGIDATSSVTSTTASQEDSTANRLRQTLKSTTRRPFSSWKRQSNRWSTATTARPETSQTITTMGRPPTNRWTHTSQLRPTTKRPKVTTTRRPNPVQSINGPIATTNRPTTSRSFKTSRPQFTTRRLNTATKRPKTGTTSRRPAITTRKSWTSRPRLTTKRPRQFSSRKWPTTKRPSGLSHQTRQFSSANQKSASKRPSSFWSRATKRPTSGVRTTKPSDFGQSRSTPRSKSEQTRTTKQPQSTFNRTTERPNTAFNRTTKGPRNTFNRTTKRPQTQRAFSRTTKRPQTQRAFSRTTKRPNTTFNRTTQRPRTTFNRTTKRPKTTLNRTTKRPITTFNMTTKRPETTFNITTKRLQYTPSRKTQGSTSKLGTSARLTTETPSPKWSQTRRAPTTRSPWRQQKPTLRRPATQKYAIINGNATNKTQRPRRTFGFSLIG